MSDQVRFAAGTAAASSVTRERDAESTLSVDYGSLVAPLTGAIEEQQKVIQDQTEYVRLLNAQIEVIEERLKSLEQKR